MIKTLAIFIILAIATFTACEPASRTNHLSIAVAANFKHTAQILAYSFNASNQHIGIDISSSSTGKLYTQILQGAPFDLFLAADKKHPQLLFEESHSLGTPSAYAQGQLILWTTIDSNFLRLPFTDSSIKKIAIANPLLAPYGIASEELIAKQLNKEEQLEKVVYGENVNQVNQFILTKSVALGITATSTLYQLPPSSRGFWKPISPEDYSPIIQYACILTNSDAKQHAKAFIEYIKSKSGQFILNNNGYLTDELPL